MSRKYDCQFSMQCAYRKTLSIHIWWLAHSTTYILVYILKCQKSYRKFSSFNFYFSPHESISSLIPICGVALVVMAVILTLWRKRESVFIVDVVFIFLPLYSVVAVQFILFAVFCLYGILWSSSLVQHFFNGSLLYQSLHTSMFFSRLHFNFILFFIFCSIS